MQTITKSLVSVIALVTLVLGVTVQAAEKRIEEVVVYGEKTESTVQDTSISITAMSAEFLEDMGVQGPNEMVNFIPATTRTDWDIKIRGIGRNFRGLGGDPGVGTYYNGIYSPDFGIASTEGGLYDVGRIEVLRGPQGTLYGRNSIGGVVNYVTNPANHESFAAQFRLQAGQYNTNEWYGFVSGPVTDALAYRVVVSERNSDGRVPGFGSSQDREDINDRNVALTLDWIATDSLSVNLRVNDRYSNRAGNFGNGGHAMLSEGPCVGSQNITTLGGCDPTYRVSRDTSYYAAGFRPVDATHPGAIPFQHPLTGAVSYGAHKRPGVDSANWPFGPSPNYKCTDCAALDYGDNEEPDNHALTNDFVNEEFEHNAGSLIVKWDIDDKFALHYLGNYQAFDYWFDRDNDFSNSQISSVGDTVLEHVWSWSHELRFFWGIGDRWTATSGLYNFMEDRDQNYGIRNRLGKGYATDATLYGTADHPNWVKDGLLAVGWVLPECADWKTAEVNLSGGVYGAYCGDPGTPHSHVDGVGAIYEHDNNVKTENKAFYTQGDLVITDNLSVTLGVRYSKDSRSALEARGGYSELGPGNEYSWLPWALSTVVPAGFDDTQFFNPGVTPLAALNVALGAATFTGDPTGENPISPTCPLESITCDRPLRLGGLPISWGSRTSGTYDTSNTSYRINFNWTPTANTLIYFGRTTSYRAGGFNLGGTDNRDDLVDSQGNAVRAVVTYDDERLVAWELGYKGTHFDGTVQVNGGIYYYDYQNYQDHVERWEESQSDFALPDFVAGGGAGRGPVSVTDNIPEAHNQGFEVDITWLATDSITLGGNYSYTESVYDSPYTVYNSNDPRFPTDVFGDPDATGADPCTLAPEVAALYCRVVEGLQLSGIPKHKTSAWSAYRMDFSQGSLTWHTSYSYTGEYWTSQFARPWDAVPSRYRIDTRFTFDSSDGRWKASLFVDNVLDKTFIRWADMEDRRTGYGINFPHRTVALSPRFIGVDFTYNFGAF